jgi:hypothetical protein
MSSISLLSQRDSKKSEKKAPVLERSRMAVVRDLSLRKDNWNIYVGDPRYKTNFLLQFVDASTR